MTFIKRIKYTMYKYNQYVTSFRNKKYSILTKKISKSGLRDFCLFY